MNLSARLSALLGLASAIVVTLHAQEADYRLASLKALSLEQLVSLDVSTVTRHAQPWWRVPGAIDVITGEEIAQSGVLHLPDALRLGAGVHVAQSSARTWAISTRGFNVISANKISVLLDGRSLFTPFFSGVQWNAQDVMLQDIDRIEIARGPVGALWGAYAVNGFIQIFTKPAWDTQGYLASIASGSEDPVSVAVRQGGRIGEKGFYRVYAKYWQTKWTTDESGRRPQAVTDFLQGGFRTDTISRPDATLTIQGDAYTNKGLPESRLQTRLDGANLLGRWRQFFPSGGELTLEGYVEQTRQNIPIQFTERRRTASFSGSFRQPLARHEFLIGLDVLWSRDAITGNLVGLDPGRRTFHNGGVFIRDTFMASPDLALTGGVKLEHNLFSGYEWSPSLRAAWTPQPQTTWWAAVSRAVRSPVRLDVDLYTRVGGVSIFEANEDMKSESVVALEAGWRHQPTPAWTVDLALFVNDYDRIRSFEPADADSLPITFKNSLTAQSHGAELTVMFQPTGRLFFKGSYRYLDLEFGRTAASRDVGNAVSEGNDPRHLLTLSGHATLPGNFALNAWLRHVGALPHPAVEDYTTADLSLVWHPNAQWEVALTGRNLLESQHRELITTNSLNEWIRRSVTAKITWRY